MNESQVAFVISALREHPANEDMTELADMFHTLITIPADEYDRNMLHGFTL
jgi:hypothetical protein